MNARVIFTEGSISIRMSELMTHEKSLPSHHENPALLSAFLRVRPSFPQDNTSEAGWR